MGILTLHIGMDDIDSPSGGCTTHFASLLVGQLEELGVTWLDYPNLVRLNPNVPYRTRGNGAVALHFRMDMKHREKVMDIIEAILDSYVEEHANTNPGVVVLEDRVPESVQWLARRALWRVVPMQLVQSVVRCDSVQYRTRGRGRGIVGALAAVGHGLTGDYTFEFLAYRDLDETEEERGVDPASVRRMQEALGDQLFSNIDPETGRILIAPKGPDPVLYGIRGESPNAVRAAATHVSAGQEVQMWIIFRTNQGTGEHLTHRVSVRGLRPYMAAVVEGQVTSRPVMMRGGHLVFGIEDQTGSIDCAVYEPSGSFRGLIARLVNGDLIRVHAGVRPASRSHPMTLNVEGVEVVSLAEKRTVTNPVCPACGKRMKSAGRGKGFKCVRCGHIERHAEKVVVVERRTLTPGTYLPPPRAQRHLTRPVERAGRSNLGAIFTMSSTPDWHWP